MAFLQPRNHFSISIHARFMKDSDYFALCSMERMYIHDSQAFAAIEQVSNIISRLVPIDV